MNYIEFMSPLIDGILKNNITPKYGKLDTTYLFKIYFTQIYTIDIFTINYRIYI